jgi:hypothetical protein
MLDDNENTKISTAELNQYKPAKNWDDGSGDAISGRLLWGGNYGGR